MRTRFIISILLLACCLPLGALANEIAVIAHPNCAIVQLSLQDLGNLYLGRTRTLGDKTIFAIDHPRDSTLRELFFKQINGMPLHLVNAYWARLVFSGQVQPLPAFDDSRMVIAEVKRNPAAIGYVEAGAVTEGVRVLLRLK